MSRLASSKISALVAYTGMIAAMVLAVAVMVRAQALAGPNRPPQVPEDYVVTPFGYFHPSCVVHLPEGEELLEGGRKIQKVDGSIYTVPACGYPHYTARGEMVTAESEIKPPAIDSWVLAGETMTTSSSYGEIVANWNVPSAPQSYNRQTIYFFPGLEDSNNGVSIIQPVLGWNSDFLRAWGIASWNCCPSGTVDESTPVRVNVGDHILGTVKSMCGSGTLSCPTWKITTHDQTTGGNTILNNSPSEGQTFNWAFGGVLEAYSVVQCSDYPQSKYLAFYPTLYDDNFHVVDEPNWLLQDLSSGLPPQCSYGGQTSSTSVTLAFGSFTLSVSISGNGSVASTDGSINCPGTCSQTYQADTQQTLNAWAASGWAFTGWSGGGCSGTGQCNVTMTQDQTVTASFLPLYTLNVTTSGNGSVQSSDGFINCPGVCSHVYVGNTPVTLNSEPAQGWSLNSWSGPCTGNAPTCTFSISSDTSVGATFTQDSYTLTVSTSGQGSITSTDHFINCPGTCSHTYLSLTPVTLNASPASRMELRRVEWRVHRCRSVQPEHAGQLRRQRLLHAAGQRIAVCADHAVPAGRHALQRRPDPGWNVSHLQFACAGASERLCRSVDGRRVLAQRHADSAESHAGFVSHHLARGVGAASDFDHELGRWTSEGKRGHGSGRRRCGRKCLRHQHHRSGARHRRILRSAIGSTLKFYPVTPCRVADTRSSDYPAGLGTPNLSRGVARDFPVLSSTCIPHGVTPAAYSLNLTAIPYPQPGSRLNYLEVWPTGQQPQNPVSTLNNPTGTNVANAAIVPAGTGGSITALASDDTHLAVDINGYFAISGSGGLALYPAPPCRVFDSRGAGQPFSGVLSPPIDVVHSPCSVPSSAQAYVFNATVVPSPTLSYLTLWPDGESQPGVSTLNAGDGYVTSNMAVVSNHGDGKIDAYAQGTTQLILDISSYFAP